MKGGRGGGSGVKNGAFMPAIDEQSLDSAVSSISLKFHQAATRGKGVMLCSRG